jgi:heme exporter protein D
VDAIMNYLDMGGYAAWIWPCYGLAALALVTILVTTLRTLKARTREFDALKASRRGDGRPPIHESRAFPARGGEAA